MSGAFKAALATISKAGSILCLIGSESLNAADRAQLKRLGDWCEDPVVWGRIEAEARANGQYRKLSPESVQRTVIWYALQARRIAEAASSGNDPIFQEALQRRAELLALAQKAEDLARYYQEVEKYPGTAMFFQRFLDL